MVRGSRLAPASLVLIGWGALLVFMTGCSAVAQPEPTIMLQPTPAPTRVQQAIDLMVLYTSDTVGSTEPCG